MKKIKNCLITDHPSYFFDIEYDGDVIAVAKMPTPLDMEKISRAKNETIQSFLIVETLVTEWAFCDESGKPLEITIENIDKLNPPYQIALINAITEKIKEWHNEKDGISKN